MKILFESDLFEPDYFQDWVDACEKHDVEYKTTKMSDGNLFHAFEEEDVFVFGSIQFMIHLEENPFDYDLQTGKIWNIANPVTWRNYECTSYYPSLAKYMLNTPYSMIPFGDLDRLQDHLFEVYGNNDCIFIRPNDGVKTFTGTVLARTVMNRKRSMDLMGFNEEEVKSNDLCVISEPRNIIREWRFVVINDKVVTGSLYKERSSPSQLSINMENIDFDGKNATSSTINSFALAHRVAQDYHPDDHYTVDICETKDGEFHLLEIGSLGCAGLYACDRERIVEELLKSIRGKNNEA
jgi:hypothetical protein